MKRILYVAASGKIGGGNRTLMEIVTRLDPSRFRASIVAPVHGPLTEWAGTRGLSCDVMPWDGWNGRAGMLFGGLRLWRRTKGATIVHAMSHTCYRSASLAASLAGARRVCHLGFPPEPGELEWSFRRGPEAVIACYDGQARELAGAIRATSPQCRVVGIPNGVDVDAFPAANGAAAESARWRFGADHMVLMVGNLLEAKGYPTWLRAAARIARELPRCAFVSLGGETFEKGYGATLEALATELGIREKVHFLGWRREVSEILRAADVMTLPSRAEGLPIAILEAMATAKPVIATPVGGIPEAIVDGVSGLLVPPNDPDRLADAILRLLRDPDLARRIGAAARQRVQERFSIERFVKSVEALYDEL